MNSFHEVYTPKAVVEVLMRKQGEGTRTVEARTADRAPRQAKFLVCNCPKRANCRDGGTIYFEKGSRYTNPFRYRKSCVTDGSTELLNKIYNDTL